MAAAPPGVKLEAPSLASTPSDRSGDPMSLRPHYHQPPPSVTNTYAPLSEISDKTVNRSRQPPTVNDPFARSDAPPPSNLCGPAFTAPPSVSRTRDGSEPVFLEMRNRTMPLDTSMQSQNDSFFDGSFRDIGAKLKACNDTLGELQQLGVSHYVSLPQLVLVGDQSAGKSSLMSGLAGLNLPRSEGVCTRCPIHIRVSRHPEWSCRVSLQLDYAFDPPTDGQIFSEDVTSENPFPPWKRQTREVKDFMTIYDHNRSDIENVLRWAQVAILNYGQGSHYYIPGTGAIARTHDLAEEAENTAAKFSPNTVALEIKGPDLPDLSFYDLPGIFRNSAREEDEYLVRVVENLARQHIEREDALIIWAVPMNADPETSSTLSIIRGLGAQHRTIGVMTKADLLPNDANQSHNQWLAILRGERHFVGHGYFITSRPTDGGLEQQARWEEALFSEQGHEKWPGPFLEFRDRSGVERLKSALSEKLGKEFAKNLPSIKSKVRTVLDKNQKRLANLPELPANIELEVRKSLMNFSSIVKEKLQGKEFSSEYGKLAEAFRDCLLQTKPRFNLKDASDIPVLEISDDEDDDPAMTTPSNRKRGNQNGGNSAAKRIRNRNGYPVTNSASGAHHPANHVKTEEASPRHGTPGTQIVSRRPKPVPIPPPFERFTSYGSGFRSIRAIRQNIQDKTKAGMPNLVPDEVYEDLCKEAVKHWNEPLETFLEATMKSLKGIITLALQQAFGTLKRRLVFEEAKNHMQSFLGEIRTNAKRLLDEFYFMESYQLFTVNKDSFSRYELDEGHLLSRYRHHMRWNAFNGDRWEAGDLASADNSQLALPKFQDWESMTPEQRASEERRHAAELIKMGPDPFEKEIRVASYVRGYYRLAALRLADTATLFITSRVFPQIVRNIDCYLDTQLGLIGEGAPAMYAKLMDESYQTARTRSDCKMTVEKLKKAMESIVELEQEASHVEAASVASVSQWGGGFGGRNRVSQAETIADTMDDGCC